MPIRDQIIQIVRGHDLSEDQAAEAMEEIMTGMATPAQVAALLTALHLKGETDAEIAGMARVMRAKAIPVHFDAPLLDTCGTGGDGAGRTLPDLVGRRGTEPRSLLCQFKSMPLR